MKHLREVTLTKLLNPVRASHKDQNSRDEEECEEDLESLCQEGSRAHDVVCEEEAEYRQGRDLENETRLGDFDSDLDLILGLCPARLDTADRLEDKRDDIKGNEDPIEELGVESRKGSIDEIDAGYFVSLWPSYSSRAYFADHLRLRQRDVDCCTKEDRGRGNTH